MTLINRFNLNINSPRNIKADAIKMRRPNQDIQGGDLRDIYSVNTQFNNFNNYLNSRGLTYQQFSQMQWNAKMASIQQKEVANQTAGQTIVSGFESIVNNIKNIFGI